MSTETWTSKKFVLAILVFAMASAFAWAGKSTNAEWSSTVNWILVTYLGANVGETAVDKLSK